MIALVLIGAAAAAGVAAEDGALGRWRTETRNGIVEVDRCGSSICGRLVGSDGLRANPNLLDTRNKDAGLRGRRLMGLPLLGGGFKAAGGQWAGGTIYNAEDGGTYKATVSPVDADHLRVKGCIVWPLCKSQTWTRVR